MNRAFPTSKNSLHRHARPESIVALPRRAARKSFAGIVLLGLCLPNLAGATCGQAFCMVNTNWNLQGMVAEPGLRLDTRLEFIDQDQPRAGSRRVGVGEIPGHHDEVRTINRNLVTTLDYAFDSTWGVTVVVPLVSVDHRHVHNHHGTQIPETWDFSRLGDVRVLGRFQRAVPGGVSGRPGFFGANMGLKLPAGERDFANGEGALAERSLQPGSGTTDLLVGGSFSQVFVESGASWFVQALVQAPLDGRDGYRPGNRYTLDVGYRYEATRNVGVMLQVNALLRRRDRGAQAEPENSGGRFVYLSPGLSYALSRSTQVYGFVQVPVDQHVNGVQLTADLGAVVGFTARF